MLKNKVLEDFNDVKSHDFLESIARDAPCFLEDTDDARRVRSFFKEQAAFLRFPRFGWTGSLSSLAVKFNDKKSLDPMTNDLKNWRDKGTKARRRYVNGIQIKCLKLADDLDKEDGIFEHLTVGDVMGLAFKSKAALDKGVGFYHLMSDEAVKPELVEDFEGVEGMLLVDFIRMIGAEAQGMMEIDRLDKNQNRGSVIEVDMRDFVKDCLVTLNNEFKLEERPVMVLTALVNMKYSGASVGADTVQNWLRS